MNSVSFTRTTLRNLLRAGLMCTAFAIGVDAQVETQTRVDNGTATQEVAVRRGEVVCVFGNDVVIKGDDGRIRDFPNVPESARVTVDGEQLGVHDLRPGMTIERTTITTTTPRVITTIKTVTGTVWNVEPPTYVTLTLKNGKNQQFRIPEGTKFTIDGQPADAFSLRSGMKVSATAVTEIPETQVTRVVNTTGEMPRPSAEALKQLVTLLILVAPYVHPAAGAQAGLQEEAQEATPPPVEPTPSELPKTGSLLPLICLLGAMFCFLAFGLRARRAFSCLKLAGSRNSRLRGTVRETRSQR